MMKLKLGTNFTLFLGFFGVSMLEAFRSGDWIKAAFWLAIAFIFLAADNVKKNDASL